MAFPGGLGRFSRGKPTTADSASATSQDDSNLASDAAMKDDHPSDMEVHSNWMSFGQFDGGTSDFDVSDARTDFNDFAFQDAATAETDDFGLDDEEQRNKDAFSVAKAPSGLRMFKAVPSASASTDQGSTSGTEATPDDRGAPGPGTEGIENNAGMARMLPGGSNPTQTTRHDATPTAMSNSSDDCTQSLFSFGGDSNDQRSDARNATAGFDAGAAATRRTDNLGHSASRGLPPPSTGHRPRSDSESTGSLALSSMSNRGSSGMNTSLATQEGSRKKNGDEEEGRSFHSGAPAASNWTSNFDPHQGYLTANESTRVIPVPPSADKWSRLSPLGHMQQDSSTRPSSTTASGRNQPAPPETPPASVATSTNVTEKSHFPQGPSNSRSSDQSRNGSNTHLSTPSFGGRRGGSLTSNVPAVTPGSDSVNTGGWSSETAGSLTASAPTPQSSYQKQSSLGFSNQGQTRPNSSVITPITPMQDSVSSDAMETSTQAESATNNQDTQGLNFEDLHAKFLMDIRDLNDLQDDNGARLLSMQGLFATAYGESLQAQANLMELLLGVEKATEMAHELTSKLEAF